ncbi:MAG: hypothetical protein LC715_06960 [Gammaproteobacteria bacterium]|nr:hypothetical protein [Gammaproteobacteria bacterium]
MSKLMKSKLSIALVSSALLLGSIAPGAAQHRNEEAWTLDPQVLASGSKDLLLRAPDASIDALFQAVHGAAQDPGEASAMCRLFDPQAERSLETLNALAMQLGERSRERFANAAAEVLIGGMQSPLQPYDPATARQALKASGVTAAILHDGFVRGLNADGSDAESRELRCRSLRWLLDAMQTRPQRERAAMTRLLLSEGLAQFPVTP